MVEGLTSVTSSVRLPRLLIAEKSFSNVEPLLRTFGDRRLNIDFDVSGSHHSAVGMLLTVPYQLIISNAHLAEMDDFLLIKRAQALETFVPFVVTATAPEKSSARRLLEKGAFDLIASPLDHEQTVRTIRLALWQNKLRALIVRKEAALEKYRQHLADYPDTSERIEESFHRALSAFEKTIASLEKTIVLIEESTICFSDFATTVEHQVRAHALERLDGLGKHAG